MNSRDKEKTESHEAQMVIIGSGGGALAAAVAAGEKGVKDIIMLEKRGNLGGNSARAEGIFACESPVQRRLGINISRDEYFKKSMRWAHWRRVNPRVVRAYINKSGDTIRWLEEKGINFGIVTSQPGQLPCLGEDEWHLPAKGPEGRSGARLIKVLDRNFKVMGGQLLLNTSGKKILRGAKGEVNGVIAATGDGKEIRIKTDTVVIATGGFAANKELLRKYCPEYSEGIHFDNNAVSTNTGDGLMLAADAGAALSDAVSILKEGPRSDYKRGLLFFILSPHALWVNKKGRRFIDEGAGYMASESANAVLIQPDCMMYSIFDNKLGQDLTILFPEEIKRSSEVLSSFAPLNENELRKISMEENSPVKIADTVDDIAKWIGAKPDVLKTTVKEYNSFCDREYDEEFSKDRRLLHPVREAPFYAIRGIVSMIDTLGGIRTNEHMEVLDNQENVIPGLYAAGVIVDGFEGETYDSELAGSAFSFAVNSGRIAGESLAEFVLAQN